MKILIIGATGYIDASVTAGLVSDGHSVGGLARSDASVARLRQNGVFAVRGDLSDPPSLSRAILAVDPDVVVTTASAGGGAGDARAFRSDREAIWAIVHALEGRGKSLIFTSGSAVFGVFAGGEQAGPAFSEETNLPLPREVFAPASARVPDTFADELSEAISARVEAEQAVLNSSRLRGIVIRPGNVYGHGGSVDISKHIEIARLLGIAPHLGSGRTTHGYVHIDDLAQLYRLAIGNGEHGEIFHAVAEEVSQRDLAAAISRMIGAGDRTESLTLEEMYSLGGTRAMRLSINKRLSANRTRKRHGWAPSRTDVLKDVEFSSYATS